MLQCFFNDVEALCETQVDAKKLDSYKGIFKSVVPSKSEEKRLGREFESVSGYSFLPCGPNWAKEKEKGRFHSWKINLHLPKKCQGMGITFSKHMKEDLHIERSLPTDLQLS